MKENSGKTKRKLPKAVKRVLTVTAVLALVGALYILMTNLVVVCSTKNDIVDAAQAGDGYDCILVLGCAVYGSSPSPMLSERVSTGIELYKAGASARLLMSGDHGETYYNEVAVMKRLAVADGVPEDVIFCDHAGFSTYESIYRAKYIFGAEKVLIVTQEYHLPRALFIAESLGMETKGVCAYGGFGGQIMRDVREVVARSKEIVYCLFKPEPKYLGDKIDLGGSASQTDG